MARGAVRQLVASVVGIVLVAVVGALVMLLLVEASGLVPHPAGLLRRGEVLP